MARDCNSQAKSTNGQVLMRFARPPITRSRDTTQGRMRIRRPRGSLLGTHQKTRAPAPILQVYLRCCRVLLLPVCWPRDGASLDGFQSESRALECVQHACSGRDDRLIARTHRPHSANLLQGFLRTSKLEHKVVDSLDREDSTRAGGGDGSNAYRDFDGGAHSEPIVARSPSDPAERVVVPGSAPGHVERHSDEPILPGRIDHAKVLFRRRSEEDTHWARTSDTENFGDAQHDDEDTLHHRPPHVDDTDYFFDHYDHRHTEL